MSNKKIKTIIQWSDFTKVDIRIGTIISAEVFENANKPAYKMSIDFGEEIGIKKSSAQITDLYHPDQIIGKQIVAIVNLPSKQIANFMSECLVLGCVGNHNIITLLQPDREIPNGTKIE